jgi:hypothetical protein
MDKIITKYDYDLNKFFYDDEISIADSRSKIKIFRSGEGFKYNRIFLKTPRMRLAFDPKNNKYNTITLALHPLTEEIKDFYNFIKQVDKLNKKKILEIVNNKKIKYRSNIIKKKKTNYRYIQFNLSNSCTIFNNNRELSSLSDMTIQNDVKLLIELNHIWIKDNKCGSSWEVYQIKYYPFLINLEDCFILSDDEEDEGSNKTNTKNFKYTYKCINCSSEFFSNDPINHQYKINNNFTPNISQSTPAPLPPPPSKTKTKNIGPAFRPPTVKDLLNMREKLKKSTN